MDPVYCSRGRDRRGPLLDKTPNSVRHVLMNCIQELRDVVLEANAFKEGWGNTIFQTANEMANAQRIRDRTDEVTKQAEAERKWWDEKRKRAQRELLGEVNSDEDGVLVESAAKKQAKIGA